jgi:hypothetical protein
MNIALPLDRMTTAEKIEVMEAIWADLSRDESRLVSPAWHEDVLRRREAASQAGLEKPIDWDTAKRRLRDLRA